MSNDFHRKLSPFGEIQREKIGVQLEDPKSLQRNKTKKQEQQSVAHIGDVHPTTQKQKEIKNKIFSTVLTAIQIPPIPRNPSPMSMAMTFHILTIQNRNEIRIRLLVHITPLSKPNEHQKSLLYDHGRNTSHLHYPNSNENMNGNDDAHCEYSTTRN